jgi:hypothetical protein
MVEAEFPSETPVNIHQAAWHHIPEDSHLHFHGLESFKRHMMMS